MKLLSFAAVQLIFFVFKEINAFGQISFSSFSRDLTVLHRVLIVIIIMSNFLSSVCTITCCFVSSPNKSNLLNEMIFYRSKFGQTLNETLDQSTQRYLELQQMLNRESFVFTETKRSMVFNLKNMYKQVLGIFIWNIK